VMMLFFMDLSPWWMRAAIGLHQGLRSVPAGCYSHIGLFSRWRPSCCAGYLPWPDLYVPHGGSAWCRVSAKDAGVQRFL